MKLVSSFSYAPCTFEFKRKISDSPNVVSRYGRTMEGFARFLESSGLIPNE